VQHSIFFKKFLSVECSKFKWCHASKHAQFVMIILLVLVFLQPYMFITVQAQSRLDHANLYLTKPDAHQNSYKSSRTVPDASSKNFATDLQLYPSEENNSIETVFPTPLLFNTVISSVSDKVDDVPSQYSFNIKPVGERINKNFC